MIDRAMKSILTGKPTIAILLFIMIFGHAQNALSHNKVVVTPFDGSQLKPLKNVVLVAKSGGDFADPIAALNSISDADYLSPYQIFIAPGEYTLSSPLLMKPFVDVRGSGAGVTTLRGEFGSSTLDASAAMVVSAADSILQGLSIRNFDRVSSISIGLFSPDSASNASFSDLEIVLAGPASRYGIVNQGADVIVSGVQFDITGLALAVGMLNVDATSDINRSTFNLLSPNGVITGIQNGVNAYIRMLDCEFNLVGSGAIKRGISSQVSSSGMTVRRSRFSGTSAAIEASSVPTANQSYISNTMLDGGVSGDLKCNFVFLNDGTPLNGVCL